MRLPIFVLLLACALVGTAAALRIASSTTRRQGVEYAVALSAGTAVVWLLVSISSLNVVTVSNGSELTHSYPSLGILGVLGVGVSMLVLIKGSITLLGE